MRKTFCRPFGSRTPDRADRANRHSARLKNTAHSEVVHADRALLSGAAMKLRLALLLLAACAVHRHDRPCSCRHRGGRRSRTAQKSRPAPSDTPPPTWCDQVTHDFCSDFDKVATLDAWDITIIRGNDRTHGDHDDIDTASTGSAPYAYQQDGRFHFDGRDNPSIFSGVFFVKDLAKIPGNGAHVGVRRPLRRAPGSSAARDLEGRTADGYDITYEVTVSFAKDATYLAAALGPIPTFPPIAMGAWVSCRSRGRRRDGVVLAFDGTTIGSAPLEGKLADDAAKNLFYFGFTRSQQGSAYDISYDNVTVDLAHGRVPGVHHAPRDEHRHRRDRDWLVTPPPSEFK